MDLLSEIASDRLVIMVTHNPELAYDYANRIVKLHDGQIADDSNPFDPSKADEQEAKLAAVARDKAQTGRKKHASMSFLTALALSFNNLMTKKGRTFLTAFAGSIGIIGIAAILALSNGVNNYIAKALRMDTLSSTPLTITQSRFDVTSIMMQAGDYVAWRRRRRRRRGRHSGIHHHGRCPDGREDERPQISAFLLRGKRRGCESLRERHRLRLWHNAPNLQGRHLRRHQAAQSRCLVLDHVQRHQFRRHVLDHDGLGELVPGNAR